MIRSLVGAIFGSAKGAQVIGDGVTKVAEVFRPNATRALELSADAYAAAHASHLAEFQYGRAGWFDTLVNGLNRLPRPLLALGTLALFIYAMADPAGFARRMQALATVPEPLWWLLGAVVAFYFGAREAHHARLTKFTPPPVPAPVSAAVAAPNAPANPAMDNPALSDWRAAQDP
ncbi:holin family protein [Roseibaca sp. Y0-43]|uniref:holin family protein n=1 Tax=Roseibaca sp. Y0-43 TaxID=2816854 RepID=UPI001D0CA34C|nr:holin family protein [Roseibaca sp. Y0-43]MCC1480027.1 holin family protein [Roseibaca sp. Y0-43]